MIFFFLLFIIFQLLICIFANPSMVNFVPVGFSCLYYTILLIRSSIGKNIPIKKALIITTISIFAFVIPFILAGYLTKGAFIPRFFCACLTYCAGIFLINKYCPGFMIGGVLTLLLPPIIIMVLPVIIVAKSTHAYPLITSPFLGVLFGWIPVAARRKWATGIAMVVCLGLSYFLAYKAYPLYLANLSGKLVHTFDADYLDLPMTNIHGDTTSVKTIKADIIIMDFWFIGCIPCTKSFPKLEQVYQKYKNDPSVFIASLHFHVDYEPKINSFEYIRKYTFPKLDLDIQSQNQWGVHEFPTILVFDRKRNLRYMGDMITGIPLSENDIDNIIERLKKEN